MRVRVELRDNGLAEEASEDWFVTISPQGTIDRGQVRDALLAELKQDNYTFSERHSHVHWGASASIYEIVMAVASSPPGAITIGAIGGALGSRLDRFASKFGGNDLASFDEDEAVREAKRTLVVMYPVNFGDLELDEVGVDFETKRATVAVTGPDGTKYTVVLVRKKGHVSIAKVTRTPA